MQFSKGMLVGAAELIVLHVLKAKKESYGYELIRAISQESEGIFDFEEGTLYPLLYRLEQKGFIESTVKPAPSGKKRRYYSLTKEGVASLKERKKEMGFFFKGLEHVLQSQSA